METLRIDGYIGQDDGMAILFGAPENFSLKKLTAFLDKLPAGTKELKVEINSGGGSVTEGFAIHDRLVSSGLTIYTEVLGLCGSIATIIALAAKKENRSMHANSEYFIHNPFWQPMAPDAMEADDLQRLADELRLSENKIVDFYSEKTGQKADKLQEFMDKAQSFTAEQAKEMGFVSNIIGEAITGNRKYRIAAFVERKQKSKDMEFSASQKSWIEQKLESFTKKLDKMFTPIFKAMVMDLENGGKIFIETEDASNLKGMKVFTVDDAGNKTNTAAPDGEYQLKDKRTLTVASGTITEVKEATAAPDEISSLKKKVEDLTAQLAAANNKAQTSETEKANLETQVVAMKKEVTEFKVEVEKVKNTILGKDTEPASQTFKGGDTPKSENEKWLEYKKNKNAKK